MKSRNFIKDLYVNEPIGEVSVEEIELEEHEGKWYVTIGFIRLWDRPSSAIAEARGKSKESNRVHKSVGIRDSDGEVVSMTDRVQDFTFWGDALVGRVRGCKPVVIACRWRH